jgi:formyltetrahydrofolate deformylase
MASPPVSCPCAEGASLQSAVVLIECPDQQGLIARYSGLVRQLEGNIVFLDQHTTAPERGLFFMRLEFGYDPARLSRRRIEDEFAGLSRELGAVWIIRYSGQRPRCGILVSAQTHCLSDLLYRHASGELAMDPAVVLSNHEDGRRWAELHGIPFVLLPKGGDKAGVEAAILERVKGGADFLVLARYMQILSPDFLSAYGKDIINIHHSFLPSFKGANPYQQAYERGVKVIGATAHFVTGDLDEGPIIGQVVQRVSHRDDVEALRRKGRDLERMALSNAVRDYVNHRVIRHGNKTIVFE